MYGRDFSDRGYYGGQGGYGSDYHTGRGGYTGGAFGGRENFADRGYYGDRGHPADRGYYGDRGYHGDRWEGSRNAPGYFTGDYNRGGFESGYDRDLGDQMREGWNDLKRGMRRAFGGGGYDRGYQGGGDRYRGRDSYQGRDNFGYYGNRGGYSGYGRGYDRGWF